MSKYVIYETFRVFWNSGINGQVIGLLLIIMQFITVCWSKCWEVNYFCHSQSKLSSFPRCIFLQEWKPQVLLVPFTNVWLRILICKNCSFLTTKENHNSNNSVSHAYVCFHQLELITKSITNMVQYKLKLKLCPSNA